MDELEVKLKEAEELAKENNIPFFACMVTKNDEKNTEYEAFTTTPFYLGTRLAKDYISPMLLVLNGFPVLPKIQEEDETYKSLQKMKRGEDIDFPERIE